ncbi:hypothetical protein [Kangiella sediminilitoris]|uniref:Uncharacterized protein n=1 Tax=Kangiella sediminilitoris TaxID=1144748 RepID=A0A1B3BDZ5_9GAMM|nr:hypothetical protein [Kangiella sediminilitoris]AOE50927.1 hypothetical protein KS2013_2222 [Kangiella sediminilitoris]
MRFLYVLIIASILGVGASWLINYYIKSKYEIDENVTKEAVEEIYGELLGKVESLYYIESEEKLKKKINELNKNFPTNLGVLKLKQRDKGIQHYSYGVNYFSYEREMYPHSYFYTDSSLRRSPGLMRGYVENREGDETDSLKYERVIKINDQELDIELVVDYQKLQSLVEEL